MQPVVTVHIADVALSTSLPMLRRPPIPDGTTGLLHVDVALAAPLRRRSPLPAAQARRICVVGFWRSREDADRWAAGSTASPILGGWQAVLEPLRGYGDWPGLPTDIARGRATEYDGPSVVLTLGRVRASQLPRFLRTSKPAERAAVGSGGMLWGTAMARPPFVATCSLWESTDALAEYAYGDRQRPHPSAIAADRRKGFHHRSAFVRFKPLAIQGSLGGRNPLDASHVTVMDPVPPVA